MQTPGFDHLARRTLIVEDDQALRVGLCTHLQDTWPDSEVFEAGSVQQARAQLASQPTLVILDVMLPDGLGTDLLPDCARAPMPPVVLAMSGEVSAKEAFRLAQLGVRAFLAKPLDVSELEDAIEGANAQPLLPVDAARMLVGVASIHDVQTSVRRAMLEQALLMTGWNRTATARMLQVTRQAVQHMIRDLEISPTSL